MNFYWLTYFEYRTLSVFYFVRFYSCLDTNEHPHTFRIISYVLFNKAASKCFLFLDCLCYFLSFNNNNNNIYLPTAAVSPFTFSETLACEGRISEICRWYIRETECAWILECDSCNCRKTILPGLLCKIVNSAAIYTRCLSVKCLSETFILRFNHFSVGKERNSLARSTGPLAKINNIRSFLFKIFTLLKLRQSFLHAS